MRYVLYEVKFNAQKCFGVTSVSGERLVRREERLPAEIVREVGNSFSADTEIRKLLGPEIFSIAAELSCGTSNVYITSVKEVNWA